ncbi:MAG TPA: mandelate racemase/muconate lactonizing enzyme family protein [Roseomonas sp.]|jgi:L-alanine-DL-glutamate epimerase-like enolase superfamily enzyme
MKIASFQTEIVVLPVQELFDAVADRSANFPCVTLRLRTDDGLEGIGVAFWGGRITKALQAAVEGLAEVAIGQDPMRIEAILAKLQAAAGDSCGNGIYTLAVSAIDTALWDIRGKALGQPLWRMLGGHRERIPAYASGALRRGLSLEQATSVGRKLAEAGYRQMKTQLGLPGNPTARQEVERARLVREAVGPDVELMCDINQLWRVDQAIDIGRRLEAEGVGYFWLEDVTTCDDYAGLARVNAALATPVAGGEYVWGVTPFRQLIEARSVDIVMIDLARVGGITAWMKVAGMAQAFNLPVVSHVFPEVHRQLVAAVPNGLTVEFMPRFSRLFVDSPAPVKGEFAMPETPGLGLTFDQATMDRYRG